MDNPPGVEKFGPICSVSLPPNPSTRVLLSKLTLQFGPQLSREQRQHALGVLQQPRRLPLFDNRPGAHDNNPVARDDVLQAVSDDHHRRLIQVGLDQLAD